MATRGKGWTLVIIPENQSGARQFRLPRRAVYGFVAFFALLVLYALVETGLFLAVAQKAAQVDRLRQQVRELQGSSDALARMGQELNSLRDFQTRVKKILGGTESPSTSKPDWMIHEQQAAEATANESSTKFGKPVGPSSVTAVAYGEVDIPTIPPMRGYFTQGFHPPDAVRSTPHLGLDLAAKIGTTVVASADGLVVFAGWDSFYGNLVILLHNSGYMTRYGHNQTLLCRSGQRVRQSEPIALMGNSGASSAPHLHFEVWKDGIPVDPATLIRNFP